MYSVENKLFLLQDAVRPFGTSNLLSVTFHFVNLAAKTQDCSTFSDFHLYRIYLGVWVRLHVFQPLFQKEQISGLLPVSKEGLLFRQKFAKCSPLKLATHGKAGKNGDVASAESVPIHI